MRESCGSQRGSYATRLAIVGAVLVVGLAAAIYGAGVARGSGSGASKGSAATAWPTNANGQTYGSKHFAKTPEDESDLIAVVATNGKEGYCLKTDLESPDPKTS